MLSSSELTRIMVCRYLVKACPPVRGRRVRGGAADGRSRGDKDGEDAAKVIQIGRHHNAKRLLWKISEIRRTAAVNAVVLITDRQVLHASAHRRPWNTVLHAECGRDD